MSLDLSGAKKATLKHYGLCGPFLDVREFFVDKQGVVKEDRPTEKGLMLNLLDVQALEGVLGEAVAWLQKAKDEARSSE